MFDQGNGREEARLDSSSSLVEKGRGIACACSLLFILMSIVNALNRYELVCRFGCTGTRSRSTCRTCT